MKKIKQITNCLGTSTEFHNGDILIEFDNGSYEVINDSSETFAAWWSNGGVLIPSPDANHDTDPVIIVEKPSMLRSLKRAMWT